MGTFIEATFDEEKFRARTVLSGGMDYEYLDWWHPVTCRWVPVESRLLRDCFWDHYLGAFTSLCQVMEKYK